MDKHSNVLPKSVNYGRKKIYSTGPWPYPQTLDYAGETCHGQTL
jgi:hypothetical protein